MTPLFSAIDAVWGDPLDSHIRAFDACDLFPFPLLPKAFSFPLSYPLSERLFRRLSPSGDSACTFCTTKEFAGLAHIDGVHEE
jgi:hypothetical protein